MSRVENECQEIHAPCYRVPRTPNLVTLELPLIVHDFDNCLKAVGGGENVQNLITTSTKKRPSQLCLRPSDPFAKSVESCVLNTENFLLEIQVPKWTGRKRKKGSKTPFIDEDTKQFRRASRYMKSLHNNQKVSKGTVVGKIDLSHRFRDPPDLIWSSSESHFLTKFKNTFLSGSFEKTLDFRFAGEDASAELIPPPVIAPSVIPWNYSYRQNTAVKTVQVNGTKYTYNSTRQERRRMINIVHDATSVPDPSREEIHNSMQALSSYDQNLIAHLQRLFELRPIWTRRGLRNGLRAEGIIQNHFEPYTLAYVAYIFSSGPWRDALVKYGLDPRVDPKMRVYQTMSFRTDDMKFEKQAQAVTSSKKVTFSQSETEFRHPNCPQPPSDKGHIFDGISVDMSGKIWQACDVTEPLVSTMLATAEVRNTCDTKQTGWYYDGTWGKAKAITKAKIRHLLEKGEPLDLFSDRQLRKILDVPDRILKEDQDLTQSPTYPVQATSRARFPDTMPDTEISTSMESSNPSDDSFLKPNHLPSRVISRQLVEVTEPVEAGYDEEGLRTVMQELESRDRELNDQGVPDLEEVSNDE